MNNTHELTIEVENHEDEVLVFESHLKAMDCIMERAEVVDDSKPVSIGLDEGNEVYSLEGYPIWFTIREL